MEHKTKIGNLQTLRVLLIEDSEDDALLVIRALKKGGYDPEYTRVETAEAMARALRENSWDAILCDYQLPVFSGPKAIALLKETKIDIPIIIVSGAIGEETAVECMRLGAHDYVMKSNLSRLVPAMERELVEAVSRKERRLAEEAVILSELRFKELFENMSSCVAVYEAIAEGTDFVLKDFNRAAEITEKIYRKDIIGKSVLAVFPGVQEMGLWEVLQRVWKTGQPEHYSASFYKDKRIEGWRENYVYKLPTGEVVALYNDITERIKAERRIFESEEKYRLLVENSSESIFIAQDAMLKFANRASLTLFGLPYEVLTSSPFVEFIHPEDRELVLSSHLRRLRGEIVPPVYVFRLLTREGIIKWVEIHSTIISWRGKPATLNFLTDVTERRQMEEKLALNFETQAALNALLSLSLEGRPVQEYLYSVLDLVLSLKWLAIEAKGAIFLADKAGETLQLLAHKGFSKELCTLCKTVPFGHCLCGRAAATQAIQFADRVDERHETHFEGMPPHGHYCVPILSSDHVLGVIVLYVKEGHVRSAWEEDFLKAVANSLAGTIERRQAEEALKKSESKYRLLADNVNDVIFVLDMNLHYTYVSPSVKILRGYEPDEMIKQSARETLTPSSWELAMRTLSEGIEREKSASREISRSRTLQLEMKRKDGTTVWTEVKFSFIRDEKQQPLGILGLTRDITERKNVEEELRESEKKYRDLYDFLPIPVYEMDFETNITAANRAIYEIFRATEDDFRRGFKGWKLLSQEEVDKSAGNIQRLLKGEQVAGTEYTFRRLDGSSFSAIVISSIIYNDGKPTGLRGAIIDITERKQAEEALLATQKQLQDAYHMAKIGSWSWNSRDKNITWSEELNRMIGEKFRQPPFPYTKHPRFYTPDSWERLKKAVQNLQDVGDPVQLELEMVSPEGNKRWWRWLGGGIYDDKGILTGMHGTAQDITALKTADDKLKKYAAEIADLYNNAPCGYHSLGPDGALLLINDTELQWLGYEREEIIGKKKWSDLLTADSMINFDRSFPIFQKQGWINDLEFDVIRKDGTVFPVLLNSTAIRDKEGNFIQSRSTIFDITQLKKAQFELQKMNLELAETYEELRKNQTMIIQQEKMASIGMLAAGIAHEIKNPLAIILQGVNYLQTTTGKDNELMTEVVERLNNAVLRADIIVKGLLSYARQNAPSLAEQDILALIEESLVLTEHEFRKKNVQLERQYAHGLPRIAVDGNQIKQVFVNVLLNGIDAMSRGGTLTVSVRQITDDAGKKFMNISFNDTGEGIPADKINNIFDPFYTTKPVGSTGLGLSISRGIIDRHGGTISATSKIRQGTSMIISLPI